MAVALLLLLARFQDDRDTDPTPLPGDAEKHYRLARFDEAEGDLRKQMATAPSDTPCGSVYRYTVYHLVEVDDPCELFRLEMRELP